MSAVRFDHVCKAFGAQTILDDISFDVPAGQAFCLLGRSGTGKSVTLRHIVGLVRPDSGRVLISDEDITALGRRELARVRKHMGFLFQSAALFDSLPVWENVAFALIQGRGLGRAEAKEIALQKLLKVGLNKDVAELSPAELSGGMQKRVGLARAIAADPEIIFFDEPTTGLDPIMADVINDLIVKTVKDMGVTTLSITHDMVSARKIADRIAMLYKGKIIWCGRKEDIDKSGNEFVDQFIHGRAEGPIKMEIAR